MKQVTTQLKGVSVVESKLRIDQRGSFSRLFCDQELSTIVGDRKIVQINQSRTLVKGVIRGMHFQYSPYCEMKMVRCLKGKAFDVALDLRAGSQTFLQWHAEILTPENARMLVIPEGCAHGFQSLESVTELLYLHTEHYKAECEGGVSFNDPAFDIRWPLACSEISDRDRAHSLIGNNFTGI
jgi:dTDP-4-dehydrorhamnose 3,5-epimerase